MAYSTPPIWTPGAVVAASDLQIQSDDISYLKDRSDALIFNGMYATRTTTQSISNSTDTDVTLTTEIWDVGSWIAVSATTATVPASAIPTGYTNVVIDIRASVLWAGNATGARRLIINQTGTQIYSLAFNPGSASGFPIHFAILAPAVAGDTFKLQVNQTSGGALNISSASMQLAMYRALS